jgi:radical SAM protein with 4Fe4S-binding SPASM domain
MNKKEISYDGGITKNIIFKSNYDNDFIKIKGVKWQNYRKDWDDFCQMKVEADFPPHLEIELNYSCNLRCPMCTWSMENTQEEEEDWFKFEDYQQLIDRSVKNGTKSIRLTYINEPLIRQDIDKFVKYASDAGILDVIITTNGTLLTKSMSKKLIDAGLTKINISLDATTEETYEKIRRGGNFNATVKNIHKFLKLRKNMGRKIPKIGLTFIRTKINDHEFKQFIEYWKDKVDHIGIQNPQSPFGEGQFKDPNRKEKFLPKVESNIPEKYHCPEPFKRMTVRGNGDVLGCCSFYAVDLVMGNWKEQSIKDIWNGDKMKELRELQKNGEYHKNKACKACIENFAFLTDE